MKAEVGSQVGQISPDIDLQDGEGKSWRLRDYRGRPVVLLFYPSDETPTCTKQLCSVRDNWARYQETGAEVVGINADSVAKHKRFADHHSLPLRLLSDTTGGVIRAFNMKNLIGTRRGIVVIDRDGIIRYRRVVFPVFRPSDDEVLAAIEQAN